MGSFLAHRVASNTTLHRANDQNTAAVAAGWPAAPAGVPQIGTNKSPRWLWGEVRPGAVLACGGVCSSDVSVELYRVIRAVRTISSKRSEQNARFCQ